MRTAMRTLCATFALAGAASGCEMGRADQQEDRGTLQRAADTTVTQRQVQDTSIVVTDTAVKAETTGKQDTVKKSANVRPADTLKKKTP